MVFIYTLKLIQGKYYVGKTNNSSFKLDNYFNLNSSALKYKPIELLELIPNSDVNDEDKYTRKYMDKYGINNVRDGSVELIELDKTTIQYLTQISNGTNDTCFICSKVGPIKFDFAELDNVTLKVTVAQTKFETHKLENFTKDCKKKEAYDVWCCEKCNKNFDNKKQCETHEQLCKDEWVYEEDEYYDDDNIDSNICCF